MELLVLFGLLVLLDVAAWFGGADSLTPSLTGPDARAVRWLTGR